MNKKASSRYKTFFRQGSSLASDGVSRVFFRDMSLVQRRQYVKDALVALMEDFPEDRWIREFALLGKRELTGTMRDKLIAVLYDEKINTLFLTIVLSLFVYVAPWPKVPLPSSTRRNKEFYTESRF